jgi:hypothetical protein
VSRQSVARNGELAGMLAKEMQGLDTGSPVRDPPFAEIGVDVDVIERNERFARPRGFDVVDRKLQPREVGFRRECNHDLHGGARTDPIAAQRKRQPLEETLVEWTQRIASPGDRLGKRVSRREAAHLVQLHSREQPSRGEARVLCERATE